MYLYNCVVLKVRERNTKFTWFDNLSKFMRKKWWLLFLFHIGLQNMTIYANSIQYKENGKIKHLKNFIIDMSRHKLVHIASQDFLHVSMPWHKMCHAAAQDFLCFHTAILSLVSNFYDISYAATWTIFSKFHLYCTLTRRERTLPMIQKASLRALTSKGRTKIASNKNKLVAIALIWEQEALEKRPTQRGKNWKQKI